jgi:hypothetical protein
MQSTNLQDFGQKKIQSTRIFQPNLQSTDILAPSLDFNQKQIWGTPPTPRTMRFLGGKGLYFEKLSKGSKTSDMTSEGLGEVFEGDSADMCAGKFPLVSMGGRANGQACADDERGPPSARAEISSSVDGG